MLRKVQKDLSKGELMSDSCSNLSPKLMNTSFFSIPGLFVGFSSKGLSDCDAVRSPTSPLDARIFSAFGSSFWTQRSDLDGLQSQTKSWSSKGIGLGIVDSLSDVRTHQPPNSLGNAESKSILFGPQLRISVPQCNGNQNDCLEKTGSCVTSPKSLPNYVFSAKSLAKSGLSHLGCPHFAVEQDVTSSETVQKGKSYRSCSSESINASAEFLSRLSENGLLPFHSGFASPQPNVGDRHLAASSNCSLSASFSAGEIELSEDYTCVITHGPNPKTKHIYGDFILEEDHSLEIPVTNKPEESGGGVAQTGCNSFGMGDFLSTCYTCKKKLADGEDIYMYRGEQAFCSPDCRWQEIMIDEEVEKKTVNSHPSSGSASCDTFFFPGLAVAT
ncbi:FCS-Like Zinc finger 8-like isoform X2 [Nymphaea colorata]|nr:FCS-Like Zinc finger 8-like isoform X2 [Nymphaea colorata]XP_031489209.1 FCS-Like Zinc finger 8-like isoform X2 [Nymphaea colorata]XP_031489210.1 FCS-Like Zinc finger 8-like isoform X2 [Nymphaea colorata]XP_031489211.1 FCS-Like Zinc finger 8-like isoform X2 [Nymphaea colorata]